MLRVEEFAVGLVGLIGNTQAYNEAFNICGDEMPSYDDVLEAISEKIGKPVLKVDVDSEFYASKMPSQLAGEIIGGRSADLTCSNSKIKRLVPEFKQKILLKEGVAKTVDAYANQNYQLGIDWAFDAVTDRIVEEWLAKQGGCINCHLGFIDYLHDATLQDKKQYFNVRYSNRLWMRGITFSKRVIRRMFRLIAKKG